VEASFCSLKILSLAAEFFIRYEKKVSGHHVQVDVKFFFFKDKDGKKLKRYQYTAIDDCTRVRALKIYQKHT